MLIDWLTLRFPLSGSLGYELNSRIMSAMGHMTKVSPHGVIEWTKPVPDWDAIRSDSSGLFWSITGDADSVYYLTIGASPSSLINDGLNVFGSLCVEDASMTLISFACRALGSILPDWRSWQCRRMDITANYDMGNSAQVKQALSLLLRTDAPRRKSNSDSKGGDTVYWNPVSDLRSAKAYHKGAHLRYQAKRGNVCIDHELHELADRL